MKVLTRLDARLQERGAVFFQTCPFPTSGREEVEPRRELLEWHRNEVFVALHEVRVASLVVGLLPHAAYLLGQD